MVPIEMSPPHYYSTYIHIIGLSCTVWLQYTMQQAESQNDRKAAYVQHHRPPKNLSVPGQIIGQVGKVRATHQLADALVVA